MDSRLMKIRNKRYSLLGKLKTLTNKSLYANL